ncbi:hypothetical protein Vi05172_g12104 [Venturia inaequalis]|nr:hypothetical protein Vi05172_g12104 [Venturia inaequalis]
MFPFTNPLGPNYSHLFLAAYICAYATVEPILETFEKVNPCGRSTSRKSQSTQPKPEADLSAQAGRRESASNVTFEEVEDGFMLVDTRS